MCLRFAHFDATTVWIRDAEALTSSSDELHPDQRKGHHVYISFEAGEAIGLVMQPILMSLRVPLRLKVELLCVVLTTLRDLEQHAHLAPLARLIGVHLIGPRHVSEFQFIGKSGNMIFAFL